MKIRWLLSILVLALAASAQGQEKKGMIAEGGDPDERASTRILYWNQQTDSSAGQFAINYGRPLWKKDYEDPAKFDSMTKGKVWRMGKDFWTNLDTQLPLKISGTNVAAGSYYLGIYRSPEGGEWALAFIDPAKVRGARLDAFEIAKAPVFFTAPMKFEKAPTATEKLTITLSHPKDDLKNLTLRVAWGHMLLTAPIKVTVGP